MAAAAETISKYGNRGKEGRSGNILLIGTDALSARPLLEPLSPGRHITAVESILEAVLISGTGRQDSDAGEDAFALILAGVTEEQDHLEAAVRSLRKVNGRARILLLCEPVDEPLCRRARAWGADDYFLLPLDSRAIGIITDRSHRTPPRIETGVEPMAQTQPAAPSLDMVADAPSLPLIVQTGLLEEVLKGAAVGSEFPQLATVILAQHLNLTGKLRFVGRDQPLAHQSDEIHHAVGLPNQSLYGTLVLRVGDPDADMNPATLLAQCADWLSGMLALAKRYEQLRSLAITDELSGAYNRRFFDSWMAHVLAEAKEKHSRVTLLLFDVDDFKKYNDTFGHASGDAIIRELIKLLRACTRTHDLVARVGGDEFAVVFRDSEAPRQPNSEHPRDVLAATERFRRAIKNHQWPEICKIKGHISISGGLATFPWDADSLEMLMAKADEALLKAKAAGKNVILLHGDNGGTSPAAPEPDGAPESP